MEKLLYEDQGFVNLTFIEMETKNREFENCSFKHCDFSNGVFLSCKFMDCVFTNCNLSMVKFPDCQMNNATFMDCKLLGLNFSQCLDFLFGVRFEGCLMDYCSFARKKSPKTQFKKCSMRHVDFFESDLSKSVFSDTDLTNAVFESTILKEVDFTTASNYSIDPERNTIKKAKFSLYGIEGLLQKYDIKIV